MKKIIAIFLAVAFVASVSVMGVSAFGANYPSSVNDEGIAAPAEGAIMMGEIIGAEGGWSDNPDVGRAAAFDGDAYTFYDPHAAGDPEAYAGIKMSEPYILTEIRILPRDGFLGRFLGAAIYGFEGDVFDDMTATLIWESFDEAWDHEFQVIPASAFIDGANTGFTSFAYFNLEEHGDIAELELFGKPAAAPAEPEEEVAPADEPAASNEAVEAIAESLGEGGGGVAPVTGDMGIMSIIIALAALAATAFVTVKMTKAKNRA